MISTRLEIRVQEALDQPSGESQGPHTTIADSPDGVSTADRVRHKNLKYFPGLLKI